ncbi:MAG TPA: aminotransferase [Nocardioides bacterium]|uniref:aminotransferase class I/II-fold pyridoxal phosphate-dependent enzyme n=1 Tax=uncultured Nocardioides sp. TaxID=198441 RepID=UPI000EDC2669|nr:aminotransferase class I/II-fold pyridoxal phosphate-dependent enzyme [uncultured Nocardioides sp.]HCB03918.1 aminotransferase [Nocardioides sp.]HRD63925.1 aminotransferase class I/II-fold pyridoxal phosphate-dependent enzyme [Nocardioides sp.]HRK47238.1 aminotransferase class I/II-fold pyridoxal phosphate-dependent enzyme [Nocardioides sp.]
MTSQSLERTPLAVRSPEELSEFLAQERAAYAELQGRGLKLDLTRGKPASAQLDLSDALLGLPHGTTDQAGVDTRNYGGLEGIAELRAMFADLLWVEPEQVVAGGNSSLVMMREVLTDLWLKGGVDSERPWGQEEKVRFICPVPGYDRHFTLLEWFGIEMVTVPMNDDGPDPDAVAELAAKDPSVKGIWVVPTYANPSGSICSQEVAERLASMATAAPDFKIFWDNAYAFHHLTEAEAKSADILSLASAAGHPHRPIMFASTSKITYAGAGVAFLAGSVETVTWYTGHLGKGAIGPDKLNQLRHAQFFGSPQGVRDHMKRHAEIIAPKFESVLDVLGEQLGGLDIARWTEPTGGYFISLDVLDGTAARVIELAKGAGVALTQAGSSFPYGADPHDRNIRLAPTFPEPAEVELATRVVATCARLAAAEKLTGEKPAGEQLVG